MAFPFSEIFSIGAKIIDRVIPDPEQKAQAQLELLKLQSDNEFRSQAQEISVLLAEAQSSDKWTSRARPAFLYVVYALILFGIPMGLVSAFSLNTAQRIAEGFNAWLKAIPPDFVDLMQIVMLGYIGGRSFEKIKGVKK